MAMWFGAPYNKWYVGKINKVDRRRTKTENVIAEFNDEEYGKTLGHVVVDKDTYGADKKWCILKGIPIALDDDSDSDSGSPPPEPDSEDEPIGRPPNYSA